MTNIEAYDASNAPGGVVLVLKNLLMNLADNPFSAIANANYIGILAWASIVGFALKSASEHTKVFLSELSDAVSFMVKIVIRLAPFGVFGLVAQTLANTSFGEFVSTYAVLLLALVGAMLFVALVLNPLIVFVKIRKNPYPLVLTCLSQSGLTAFFTRSSAANIPVNMDLCKKLNLNPDTLFRVHTFGCNHQYGRCGGNRNRDGFGCYQYFGHFSRLYGSLVAIRSCVPVRMRCVRRGRRFVAVNPFGVQFV